MLYPFTLLLTICFCTCVRAQTSDGFVLQTEDGAVQVYVREESNSDMSVRVITVADADVMAAKKTLDDAASYPEWVHRCDGAYIVAGGTPDDYVYVSGIDLPFPFRDKEVVARIQQWINAEGVLTRTITSTPDAIPSESGRDRLTTYFGEWIITPLPNGEGIKLQCTVRTDAGSGLPGWLRREILTGGPAETVANLRRRLEAAR
ncbi:polyketide cyclase/dehydrase/lipid transport protein [Neolewinella xylanilytica]|uniref:Polyketide cyclase/dehydrase/lipid transport protein n=1 Tax=Neolewinella xylanilytica TaxID=1514080 RepID=A0A2S6I6E9_9BACT|nr:START domain-containing protein [Neolewinella xylanilytica]PPK86671.1 polyketide cyclase/dehydrase/lipid transport protein [Neolewinella xylanilytica]